MSKVSGGFNRSVPDVGGERRPGWEREKGRPGENAASSPSEVESGSHEVEGSPDEMEGKAMSANGGWGAMMILLAVAGDGADDYVADVLLGRGLFGKEEENMYF